MATQTTNQATESKIKVGDKFKINQGAKTNTGSTMKAAMYQNTYEVLGVKEDCAVIGFKSSNSKVATIKFGDLEKA